MNERRSQTQWGVQLQPLWGVKAISLQTVVILGCFASGCGDDDSPTNTMGAAEDDTGTPDDDTTGAPDDDTTGTPDDNTTGTPEDAVTYWEDVAPIMFERCGACHQEGGIGPFSLTNAEDAKTWAQAAAAAVESRIMPPWLVTSDGSCGDFSRSPQLTDAEIATIVSWANDGAEAGEPRTDLQVTPPSELESATSLMTPTFVPEIAGGTLAAFDEYRCFLIDPEIQADTFLTGYNVVPGNASIVHHVLAMPVDPAAMVEGGLTNLDVITALDQESPDRDGWPCFGVAGEGVDVDGIPVTWAPGQGIVDFPADTGVRVPAGRLVVVQIHYNLADPQTVGQSDQTEVQLRLQPSVAREGFFDLPDALLQSVFAGEPIALEAGQASVDFDWDLDANEYLQGQLPSIEVYGAFPHMHEYGRSMSVTLERADGSSECVADVPRWDFGWQLYYFYETPIQLGAGDRLHINCNFDTSSATEPVYAGWGTRNEMCLFGLFLVP